MKILDEFEINNIKFGLAEDQKLREFPALI
jgi:hypothetical protein